MKLKITLLVLLLSGVSCAQTLTSSNLPIVVVTTNGGVQIPDDPRVVAHMGIIYNGPGVMNNITDPYTNYDGRIEIEIRGSTSQQYPKKNYALETQDSLGNNLNVSILGMGGENDWILYGPYPDKTLIRNRLTFHLARKMGHYAPRMRYCEMMLNGDYRGVYLMMERIKIDDDRVNIADVHEPSTWGDSITGGYIVKVDKLTGEVGYSWVSQYNNEVIFQLHDPEFDEISSNQVSYIENFINDFEDAMNGASFMDQQTGYPALIDEQSFQDFFILQELGRTVDGYRSSSFLYKDRDAFSWNSKLVAGPMWDFNLSFGNADYCLANTTTGWQYNFDQVCNFSSSIPFWWERLLDDPMYCNWLRCRWDELRQGPLKTSKIHSYIDSIALDIQDARIRNFQRWPIIGVYVNWNGFVGNTYQEDVDYFKNYIAQRAAWMDANIPGNCNLAVESQDQDPEYHTAWPNPFVDELMIGFSLFSKGEIVVEITDLTGRTITKEDLGVKTPGTHAIQICNAVEKSGNYFYNIRQDEQIIYTGKLIKH